jgi:hypothetical protein
VKNWFQSLPFKCDLQRYNVVKSASPTRRGVIAELYVTSRCGFVDEGADERDAG